MNTRFVFFPLIHNNEYKKNILFNLILSHPLLFYTILSHYIGCHCIAFWSLPFPSYPPNPIVHYAIRSTPPCIIPSHLKIPSPVRLFCPIPSYCHLTSLGNMVQPTRLTSLPLVFLPGSRMKFYTDLFSLLDKHAYPVVGPLQLLIVNALQQGTLNIRRVWDSSFSIHAIVQ